ncbi:MAG: hypothetical protein GY870_00220, partial [archaeon]|nr:hypothetical protein [archaeon]
MVENLTGIDVNEFVNPPKKYRPIVRWWWTGTDIEKDELIREVGELDEAGFLGAEIQCFMIHSPFRLEKKDPERAKRSHRFMQPYYYQMLKAVLDEAEKREMVFDITENSSWPAGGVHITKEDSMKTLLFNQKVIKGGKKYKGKLPKFKKTPFYRGNGLAKRIIKISIMEFFPKDMKLKAVIAGKPLGKPGKIHFIRKKTGYIDFNSVIDITEKINENGILEWDVPEGKWQIFAFYEGPSGARPLLDSRSSVEGESLVLDHFASDSIKNHLDAHLGEG